MLVGTLVLVYRKYVRHKRLLSRLERGEVEGEVQPVLSIREGFKNISINGLVGS